MAQVKNGDTVKVHYTGKFEDGTVFDSSKDSGPFEFTIGQNQVIPGFEEAVMNLEPGQSTTSKIPKEKAYGPYVDDYVIDIERSQYPQSHEPEVGHNLQIKQPNGQVIVGTVTEINDDKIKIDANHPLAGKELTFDIELIEII